MASLAPEESHFSLLIDDDRLFVVESVQVIIKEVCTGERGMTKKGKDDPKSVREELEFREEMLGCQSPQQKANAISKVHNTVFNSRTR